MSGNRNKLGKGRKSKIVLKTEVVWQTWMNLKVQNFQFALQTQVGSHSCVATSLLIVTLQTNLGLAFLSISNN